MSKRVLRQNYPDSPVDQNSDQARLIEKQHEWDEIPLTFEISTPKLRFRAGLDTATTAVMVLGCTILGWQRVEFLYPYAAIIVCGICGHLAIIKNATNGRQSEKKEAELRGS